ncbi:MAG TPA: hypothetical protein VF752_16645 [Thermoleophilaceae bacterium]
MSSRARITSYGSAAAVVLAGALCVIFISGITGQVLGITLITVGLGAVVLLVFFEVGLSEDRELAAEEQRRRKRMPKHDDGQRPPRRRPRRRG